MSAETWLGAAGCASGSQTCSGTRPAFVPNPTRASAKSSEAGSPTPPAVANASKRRDPATLPSARKSAKIAAVPRCEAMR